ncbi:MAG TPA: hypothetical protein VF722_09625 [Gemmatimonadaceae bacterium]|jgi:hypothetical protein|nr:hypothetical protein [Sphingomicrobium sp.]
MPQLHEPLAADRLHLSPGSAKLLELGDQPYKLAVASPVQHVMKVADGVIQGLLECGGKCSRFLLLTDREQEAGAGLDSSTRYSKYRKHGKH